MKFSDIGWTICMFLWLINFIVRRKLQKENDIGGAGFFLTFEWMSLGFATIFLGLSHGWWQKFFRIIADYIPNYIAGTAADAL